VTPGLWKALRALGQIRSSNGINKSGASTRVAVYHGMERLSIACSLKILDRSNTIEI
jgi:hypothetical protein